MWACRRLGGALLPSGLSDNRQSEALIWPTRSKARLERSGMLNSSMLMTIKSHTQACRMRPESLCTPRRQASLPHVLQSKPRAGTSLRLR